MKKLVLLAAAAGVIFAQDPLSKETKGLYTSVKTNIIKSAEKMPEANYSFKPSPDVRSYAQLIGHVIDAQYMFCSAAKGEQKASDAEKKLTKKADLEAALTAAFAYCDTAYDALTDAGGTKMMKFFGADRSVSGILNFNVAHDFEHYGNIVTYLRIKGIVPPSSAK